jgi:hypothetical protein
MSRGSLEKSYEGNGHNGLTQANCAMDEMEAYDEAYEPAVVASTLTDSVMNTLARHETEMTDAERLDCMRSGLGRRWFRIQIGSLERAAGAIQGSKKPFVAS